MRKSEEKERENEEAINKQYSNLKTFPRKKRFKALLEPIYYRNILNCALIKTEILNSEIKMKFFSSPLF